MPKKRNWNWSITLETGTNRDEKDEFVKERNSFNLLKYCLQE